MMAEDQDNAWVSREQHGPIAVLTMSYRPYNLLGPKLIGAIGREMMAAHDAGSRAIVLKSGLRHFCAGADVGLFTPRIEGGGRPRAGNKSARLPGLVGPLPRPDARTRPRRVPGRRFG